MTRIQFDARTVEPDQGIDPLPAGWYISALVSDEMKPTNDGSGAYLGCKFRVLDGQYKGRTFVHRFNLRNQNEQAVKISYGQLSALCHAAGQLLVEDTQVLYNIPVKVKLALKAGGPKMNKETGQPTGEMYEASNEVRAFKNVNEPTEAAPAAATLAAPAAGWGAPPTGAFAPPPAPAAAPAAPPMAPAQPWAQAPAAPAPAPAAPPAAAAPMAPPWGAPGAGAPAPAPAPGGAPPWAAPGGGAPPWATPAQ